jgi:hypothetical protein
MGRATPTQQYAGVASGSAVRGFAPLDVEGTHPFLIEDRVMSFTSQQLITLSNYALEAHQKNSPVDQVNNERAILKFLMDGKKPASFTGGRFRENVYIQNNSNYQNYHGADAVTYNRRDPVRQSSWAYASFHDGFHFDEDTLVGAGIVLTDDTSNVPTASDKAVLADYLANSFTALKEGVHENLSFEAIRDGTQSAKAMVGLEGVISATPNSGTIGGFDASAATWWRNNASTGISGANLIDQMEIVWRACTLYGGESPDKIFCGSAFLDEYRTRAGSTINRETNSPRGGVELDASVTGLFFKGIPLVWDPELDRMDSVLSTTTRAKSAYFINSKRIALRPVKGHWMVRRKPARLPDRYVHYWGLTSKQAITTDRRRAHALLRLT